MQAGVETDNPAARTWKTILNWIFTNAAAKIFCIGVNSQKVFYKSYTQNPQGLRTLHPVMEQLDRDKSFSAPHMLAGNVIRMRKDLK